MHELILYVFFFPPAGEVFLLRGRAAVVNYLPAEVCKLVGAINKNKELVEQSYYLCWWSESSS